MEKNTKKQNQIKIIKNKEIIIYKNGKKFKHFKRTEKKKLNENEMYILDYLLNKYMGNEVNIESDNSKNYESNDDNKYSDLNSNDRFSESNNSKKLILSKKVENEIESDEEEKVTINNMKMKKKNKNKMMYQSSENEEDDIDLKKYSEYKKNKYNEEKLNESNEEEEENDDEGNFDSKIIHHKKDRKKNREYDDNDEISEEKIKKRIIKHYKEPYNKVTKKSITKVTHGDVVEIKQIKKQTKAIQTRKILNKPNEEKKSKKENYSKEIKGRDVKEKNEYKNEEPIPQYISQLKSYTSPTIKFINEQKAEQSVLSGIPTSTFSNGREINGIIFLDKNNYLCFISSDDKHKEIDIELDNIKKIYFNVSSEINLKNYGKKSGKEKFIQLVEINKQINDFKFNNEEDLEYLIKGLIQIHRNKTVGVDKNLIYHIVRNAVNKNNYEEKISDNQRNKNIESNNIYNSNQLKPKNTTFNSEKDEYQESNFIKNNNEIFFNENNEDEEKKENNENDIIVTTTITEVFKDGELINKETREKMDGVMKSLHVYSPDKDEYEVFLKNTKLGQNQMVKRYNDGLPIEEKCNDSQEDNINNIEIDNSNNNYNDEED